jgi:hypothetical protein
MLADETTAAVAAAELMKWGGRTIRIIFQSIPAPFVLSIAIWRIYSGPLSNLSCSFVADRRLLSLWPGNLNYIARLQGSPFTTADQCWFIALNSTVSALYLCWLCWLVCRCIFVLRQIQHVPGTAKLILPKMGGIIMCGVFALAVGAALMLTVGFRPSDGPYGLNTLLPIGWSASKVVFYIIPYWYFAMDFMANMLLLSLRYMGYWLQEVMR